MLDRVADYLKKVVSPISGILGNITMVAIVLVVLLVVTDVCLRRFFNAPFQGTHELSNLAFSMIVFLPLAWCALKDGHVELSLLVKRFPKTMQLSIRVVMMFITVVILGLMSWQILVQGTKLQAANRETALLEIPMHPFLYLASFGSIMLTLAFLIRFIRSLSNLMKERQ